MGAVAAFLNQAEWNRHFSECQKMSAPILTLSSLQENTGLKLQLHLLVPSSFNPSPPHIGLTFGFIN